MEYKPQHEENNELNEQDAAYGDVRKRRVRIFGSFEEAAEAEAQDTVRQSPVERIKETVELILRAYGVTREDLKTRERKHHVTIIRRK